MDSKKAEQSPSSARKAKAQTGKAEEITFPHIVTVGSVSVRIYRTPSHGCESYTLSYHQDGVRKRPTFPTFEAAKKEARTVAGRLGSKDADVLLLKSADRAAYLRALDLLAPFGVSIEMAAAEYARTRNLLGSVPLLSAAEYYVKRHPTTMEVRLVPQVVDELLAAKRADKLSERYLQCLRWALGKFAAEFQVGIAIVSGRDIDQWLRRSGLSPRTRNNLRTAVQTLFSFAKTRHYVTKDHDEIDAVPVVKDREGEIEVFTAAELAEVLRHADPRLIPALTLGAFAGIRHAEILRLDWRDIRFDDGIIEVRAAKAKTASRRTLPLLDNLRKWLEPYRQESGPVCALRNMAFEMHLIAKRANEARRAAWAQAQGVSGEELKRNEAKASAAARAAQRAGKVMETVPPGAKTADMEGWTPFAWKHNALRHSFISYRVADIQNVAQVALEAGNSPQVIFKNYRELVRPKEAKAWFGITPERPANVVTIEKAA